MKHFPLLPLALLVAAPAFAQVPAPVNYTQSPAYKECTALAASNPAQALAKSDEWLKIDNGVAPLHCRAMAYYGLRRYAEAAETLAQVRDGLPRENIALRVYVTEQAAHAWVNAERADAALAILSAQITDMNSVHGDNALSARLSAELLLARARLNVTYGKLADAVADLDHAVSLTPVNEELLMERATAFAQLGDGSLARADAQAVMKINPGNTKARDFLHQLDDKQASPALRAIPATPAN